MVFDYYEDTRDKAFLAKILPAIDKELLWWQKNRQVDVAWNGTKRTLYQYKARALARGILEAQRIMFRPIRTVLDPRTSSRTTRTLCKAAMIRRMSGLR